MLPPRLDRLPVIRLEDGIHALLAEGLRARLLGLAFLDPLPPGVALMIPRCRSVHTFGMRFPLDISFLGEDDQTVRAIRGVAPNRVVCCLAARAVLERPAA